MAANGFSGREGPTKIPPLQNHHQNPQTPIKQIIKLNDDGLTIVQHLLLVLKLLLSEQDSRAVRKSIYTTLCVIADGQDNVH